MKIPVAAKFEGCYGEMITSNFAPVGLGQQWSPAGFSFPIQRPEHCKMLHPPISALVARASYARAAGY
jgi:hypothetical protein